MLKKGLFLFVILSCSFLFSQNTKESSLDSIYRYLDISDSISFPKEKKNI